MADEAREELPIGVVEHYYPKAHVAVVNVQHGTLHRGDRIHIAGHGVELEDVVRSIEVDHKPIREAHEGQHVGILVSGPVREKAEVFLLRHMEE